MSNWTRPKRLENLGIFLLSDIIGKIQSGRRLGIYPVSNETFGNVDKASPCACEIDERLVITAVHVFRVEDAFAQMLFHERDRRAANRIAKCENPLLQKDRAVAGSGLEPRVQRTHYD